MTVTVPATVAVPFKIERVSLTSMVILPVIAPWTCQSVTIGNATTGDVRVADGEVLTDNYLTIASGFERVIWLPRPDSGQFQRNGIGFYLEADDSGTVVLVWA